MGKDVSILIVDDDPGTCETLYDILMDSGFVVDVNNSGEDCLKTLRKKDFDFVLMDIKMPGISGLETIQRMQEMETHAKIIVMTAYAVSEVLERALSEGAYHVLQKPLDPGLLISLMRGE